MRRISIVIASVLALAVTNAQAEPDPDGASSSSSSAPFPSSTPSDSSAPTDTTGMPTDATGMPADATGMPADTTANPMGTPSTTPTTPSADLGATDTDWPQTVTPVPPPTRVETPYGTAQSVVPVVPVVPVTPVTPVEPLPPPEPMPSKLGAALMVGGGVEDFTNQGLQNMTGIGGSWTARAVTGTRQYVGLEAAYVGAARSIDALGLTSDAALVSNGVEGALRINVPLIQGRSLLEPFGFVGVGWQHYTLTNTNVNTSDVNDSDDVVSLPYGGGLAFQYGALMADARFTYRYTYQNDLMRTSGGRLNNWGLTGQLGVAF